MNNNDHIVDLPAAEEYIALQVQKRFPSATPKITLRDADYFIQCIRRQWCSYGPVKKKVDERREVRFINGIPLAQLDKLKDWLITWQPTLNFGWLKPSYKQIAIHQVVTEHYEVRNVYPFDKAKINSDKWQRRFAYLNRHPLTHEEWLKSSPVKPGQLDEVRELLRDIRSRSPLVWRDDEIALIMAWNELHTS